MDEQDLKDWDEEFLEAAVEILNSSRSPPPSAPATVPAPPALKISTISTSLTKAVQFQSAAGKPKKFQRRSYSSLSWRHRMKERATDEQRWKLSGDHLEDWDEKFHKTERERKRKKRAMDEQDLEEFLEAAVEVCKFHESSQLPPPSAPATVLAPPAPKRTKDEHYLKDWDEEFVKAAIDLWKSSELPLPSAPVTVLAPPAPKISKISTSLTQAVQIQSATGKLKNFPVFLRFYELIYELVDDPSSDSFISWGKNNKSFVLTNPEELVLSRFSCNTFKQLIKKLKYYGFKEISRSANVWEFGNSNFVRGQPELMVEMHNVEVQDRLKKCRI